jgi:hypothetical protein
MILYRKQLQHNVYETGMQGFAGQLQYEGEWLWEDDLKVEAVVAEANKLIKEKYFGWAKLEVKERYVKVEDV